MSSKHDALGVGARVAFPHAVRPEDSIGRFRRGMRRPKVAAALQADPELVGLPGFPGTWVCEIHERAATLAAHLKVDITHEPHSSAEASRQECELADSDIRPIPCPKCGPRRGCSRPMLSACRTRARGDTKRRGNAPQAGTCRFWLPDQMRGRGVTTRRSRPEASNRQTLQGGLHGVCQRRERRWAATRTGHSGERRGPAGSPSSTWVVPAMPSTTRAPIEAALCQTARSRTMS